MNQLLRLPLLLVLSAVALVFGGGGCGSSGEDDDDDEQADASEIYDCATETRDDEFFAGMAKTGANDLEVTLVESTPAPPSRGDNVFVIELRDGSGAAVEDATFVVRPYMPDHFHGTPIIAHITPSAETPGRYEASPVSLWMPGLFEINVEAEAPVEDAVVFRFCIAGG